MPELVNCTPYPNFRYYSRDNRNREFGIVIAKATYELAPSGRLLLAEEQAPMVFTDLCHGVVNVSSLWHPSDLVPNKPATDVIVNAVARAPNGEPAADWPCGVTIEDGNQKRLEKQLRVTGPRQWTPIWRRALSTDEQRDWRRHAKRFKEWALSDPEPIVELPLRYEYAYGGEIPQGLDDDGRPRFDTDQRNPLGRGKIDREWSDHTQPVPAPQIEDPNEPVSDPHRALTPQSLGPIPAAWLPRRPRGGTYDQNWKDTIWPAWPPDYDFSYHNSAHPDLIVQPYLNGDERVSLTGMSGVETVVSFDLPGERLFVDFVAEDGAKDRKRMNLDTLFLDIAAPSRRDWRVYASWRVNFEPNLYDQALIGRIVKAMSPDLVRAQIQERNAA